MIYLDHGHGWKGADQGYDPGALQSATLDGQEAVIARHYGAALVAALHKIGAAVCVVPEFGRYADRHAWVAAQVKVTGKRGVYVQLHGNAGGGRYALVEHDARSTRGAKAAAIVARHLGDLHGARAADGQVRALAEGERGHTCLSGIWPIPGVVGLIVEPGFLDSPSHSWLWERAGVRALAPVLAAAFVEAEKLA